jgi:hypothetical protein
MLTNSHHTPDDTQAVPNTAPSSAAAGTVARDSRHTSQPMANGGNSHNEVCAVGGAISAPASTTPAQCAADRAGARYGCGPEGGTTVRDRPALCRRGRCP